MIRNIWAAGRNYKAHAAELGNDVPSEPVVFLKSGSCALVNTPIFFLPPFIDEVHHEVELAVVFGQNLEIIAGAVALDLTWRSKQKDVIAKGLPWTISKSFKGSCPLGPYFPIKSLDEVKGLEISLHINGELRQKGNTEQMIFSTEALADYVRKHFPVEPGDVMLTGTPSGVGPIKAGDSIVAEIAGKTKVEWRCN